MRTKKRAIRLFALLAGLALVAAACGGTTTATTTEDTETTAAPTETTAAPTETTAAATDDGGGDAASMPGEGVSLTMGRANWSTGYFQAYVYEQVAEELGYDVSSPSEAEMDPSLGYLGMAEGDVDFWVNSWYPGHFAWHEAELPDGTKVGDHIEVVGSVFEGGGVQGWLITKSFADEFGIKTMDDFNANPEAIAAYDAEDPSPGNGIADIYGCQESFTCDNIIQGMIAFGDGQGNAWENITQVIAGYDAMFAEAESKVNDGLPVVIYTWTPSAYITKLIPGDNVYWLGAEAVLDRSNPHEEEGGEEHQQEIGPTGATPFLPIPDSRCPSAVDGVCPMGWLPASITPTANSAVLEANPALKALLENLALPVVDVSLNTVAAEGLGGAEDDYAGLATEWIAANRARVDAALEAARAAS